MVGSGAIRVGVAALCAAGAVACEARRLPTEAATEQGILLKGNSTEPESLDPHVVRGAAEWSIVGQLFEGLVAACDETGDPLPGAAESWEISDDALRYRFRLRDGLRWSNGDPITAQDFVYSAERLLSPGLASAHAEDTLLFVRGAKEFTAGEEGDFGVVGIRAHCERDLEIELSHPAPFFLSALVQFYPVHRGTVERFGRMDERGTAWTRPGNLVGNGPFVLEAWVPNQVIELARNPHARVRPHLNGVKFFPIENPPTEESAFRNGQLHVTASVPTAKIPFYEARRPELLEALEDFGVYFYTFNTERPPLDDARVRRALGLAVDRQALADLVLRGGRVAADSFSPPGMGDYVPPADVRFDPAEARRLLEEAGFPGGEGMRPIEILVDGRAPHRLVAEVVQAMWAEHLGVAAKITSQETRVLIASRNAREFDVVRGTWNAATFQDPHYFVGAWTSGNLFNDAGWSDADFDRLVGLALSEGDPAIRNQRYFEAERIFLREAAATPLFFTRHLILRNPDVAGWRGGPFNDRLLGGLRLEPAAFSRF